MYHQQWMKYSSAAEWKFIDKKSYYLRRYYIVGHYYTVSLGNLFQTFRSHYVASKRREPITQWRGVGNPKLHHSENPKTRI
jgi:hypothetical protein